MRHQDRQANRYRRIAGRALAVLVLFIFPGAAKAIGAATPEAEETSTSARHRTDSASDSAARDLDPLALSKEMKEFVSRRVDRGQTRFQRLVALQDAIFDPDDGLGITYGSDITRTASGTFRERSGNCLSFTLLFSALARELGLKTHFVEVDEVTGWSRRGDVDVSHGHMYVEVETGAGVISVDFLPWANREYRSRRRISETRVRSHYHNNIGVDFLTADQTERAVGRFLLARDLDATFLPARINLAVAYRRAGSTAEAEALLLEILEDDKGNATAASNLAALYLATGQEKKARTWLARRERFVDRNPFHHFRLGLGALAAGRPRAARTHLRRAIRRQPDEAVFYEELAEAHGRLGNPRRARRALRRALEYSSAADRRLEIEGRLEELSTE